MGSNVSSLSSCSYLFVSGSFKKLLMRRADTRLESIHWIITGNSERGPRNVLNKARAVNAFCAVSGCLKRSVCTPKVAMVTSIGVAINVTLFSIRKTYCKRRRASSFERVSFIRFSKDASHAKNLTVLIQASTSLAKFSRSSVARNIR